MVRGQIFSQDLVISSIIVLVLISEAVLMSNTVADRVQDARDYGIMNEVAAGVLEQLSSTGDPANWHYGDIASAHSIGLCERAGVINEAKASYFFTSAQDAEWRATVGSIMGIDREGATHDYAVEISDGDGEVLYSAGSAPASETVVVISAWRMLGNSPVLLKVKVWGMDCSLNGQCRCNEGWICSDITHKVYRDQDCSLSSLTECPYGCANGACNCAQGWICSDTTHKAYQNQDCSLSSLTECPYGCANGACQPKPKPPEPKPKYEMAAGVLGLGETVVLV